MGESGMSAQLPATAALCLCVVERILQTPLGMTECGACADQGQGARGFLLLTCVASAVSLPCRRWLQNFGCGVRGGAERWQKKAEMHTRQYAQWGKANSVAFGKAPQRETTGVREQPPWGSLHALPLSPNDHPKRSPGVVTGHPEIIFSTNPCEPENRCPHQWGPIGIGGLILET